METALYLLPVTLGDTPIEKVLPSYNKEIISGIRYFIVEDVRSARRFLKKVDREIDIDALTFYPLNKHTSPEDISGYLQPLVGGASMGVISEAGCPAVADPGADVVAIAQRKKLKVVPLVGPSSIILSVMASGFNGQSFALCGKTISSVRRNLLSVVRGTLEEMGFAYSEKVSKNYVELRCGRVCNRYYLFSGKDAASASLIQGMTLAGVLFDEVALQNREFVEQAAARCSVEGSRFWFNCNPEGPGHWFYREWLQKREQKKLYYLHFVMEDNPALSKRVRKRYELLYSGSFYRRFIQGEWVDVQGLVYPMFSLERHVVQQAPNCERFCVSCDYGTVNPCSMGLWGEQGGRWYLLAEYYYDARREGACRTDEEHYEQLERLCGNRKIERVIVDPSAASFIACIRRHGRYGVEPAKNGVLEGIQLTAAMLNEGRIRFCSGCADSIREFGVYRWSEEQGREFPVKENDHAMDDIRYFVMGQLGARKEGFFALSQQRNESKRR